MKRLALIFLVTLFAPSLHAQSYLCGADSFMSTWVENQGKTAEKATFHVRKVNAAAGFPQNQWAVDDLNGPVADCFAEETSAGDIFFDYCKSTSHIDLFQMRFNTEKNGFAFIESDLIAVRYGKGKCRKLP